MVEKKLAREQNLSRHDLGREAFVSKVRTILSDPDPKAYHSFGSGSANDFGDPGSRILIGDTDLGAMKLANMNTF